MAGANQPAALDGLTPRLADIGLRPEQLSRLAGLPVDEVLAQLEPAGAPQR